ncbi:hypothetical protein [Lactococcus lactis]|uniref:hypothetical protein n=1 Tax=Lactococcus lactis TaxID=1358 RepID=UPI001F57A9A6|nr:hypothetical protein [Lactococcus lactis]
MFNSKKFFTLCVTSIAGFSAVASIAPVSAFADVAKNGETVVTYDGTPQPVEWGLSVPSTIKLDKFADNNTTAWSCGKVEIVKADGSTFSDTSKDRAFTVSGTPQKMHDHDDRFYLFENGTDGGLKLPAMMTALPQGAAEPTTWKEACVNSGLDLRRATFNINSHADGSVAPSRYWVAGLHDGSGGHLPKLDLSNTMLWTATEK